jgi:phage-related protein
MVWHVHDWKPAATSKTMKTPKRDIDAALDRIRKYKGVEFK